LRVDAADLRLLRSWLQSCPQLAPLAPAETILLEHGLHELCANIIEHGHRESPDAEGGIDVWWIPEADLWSDESLRDPSRFDGDHSIQEVLRRGIFLVRDRGQAFSPTSRHGANLEDRDVRKRGRGLGLRIIQEIMHPLVYLAGVNQGNLTIMRFDPVGSGALKEVRHVSSRQASR
jgi:anti-sigma regulatory factor (Ser/Thr protein kinase)